MIAGFVPHANSENPLGGSAEAGTAMRTISSHARTRGVMAGRAYHAVRMALRAADRPRMTEEKRQRRSVSRVLSPSRGDGHFSRAPVTRRLERPDPGAGRAVPLLPYSALLRVGFTEPARSPASLVRSCLTVSPLPRSHDRGGLFSVALVRWFAPPGRQPAP